MDNTFPSSNMDPRQKQQGESGRLWHLQFCKAAWHNVENSQPRTMFYHYGRQYDKIKFYALGRQETGKYRKAMHVDEASNTSYAVLDYKVLPLVKKHRQIALGRLQKSQYEIVASAVDQLARDEADQYFNQLMIKLMMRDQLAKQNPQLAQTPVLQGQPGEPISQEELQILKEDGFKHEYSIAVEEGIDLIFNENNITECRQKVLEDLFDYGVAVYKDWMEPDGTARFRKCDPRSIITNYCRYDDFKDLRYCGEVVDMEWSAFREEASGQFDDDDFEKIYQAAMNQSGMDRYNQNSRRANSKGKVKILDIEWFSDDLISYAEKTNSAGNLNFGRTQYTAKGGEKTKVRKMKRRNVYKAKWIVGTDFVYDWGLAFYIKRPTGINNACLSYHIVATNFHEMSASGVMEDLIPIADQMAIAWLKLQNIRNELKPYYVDIDLSALEDVGYAKGGEELTPTQLIEMWSQNGILVTRRQSFTSNNQNYKTIEYVATNYGEAIQAAWVDFNNHQQLLRDATGFNEATDGSTVNPKNLNSTNEAMQESTNNALYHLVKAEETLLLKLAWSVLCRLKRAVKMGKVSGYVPALGSANVKYIEVSPDINDHEYGLFLQNKPSVEERQALQQMLAQNMQEGILEPQDIFLVERCRNLKQAEKIICMRISQRKQEAQQNALQQQQQTGQVQMQSAQAAEQMKQQTAQMQLSLDLQKIDREKGWDYKIMELQLLLKYGMTVEQLRSQEKMQEKELGITPEVPLNQTPLPPPLQEQQAA